MTGMSGEPYRHKVPKEQEKLSDLELARQAPSGTGVSIMRFRPYWDVVARIGANGKLEYIVTDCSVRDRKPQKVHGPVGRDAAVTWAKREATMWRALHVHHPDDEVLSLFREEP